MLQRVMTVGAETIDLGEALGRILAADVRSDEDLPAFPRAGVDGFAVHAADAAAPGTRLRLVGECKAGGQPGMPLGPGEAVRVMTGAPVPPTAGGVAWQEDAEVLGDWVTLGRAVAPGANVGGVGEDLRRGALAVQRGAVLRPAEIGLLGALGVTQVRVLRRPRVALLATGDELVQAGALPAPGQVRNSNEFMLRAALAQAGAEAVPLGIEVDDPDRIARALAAAEDADLLVTTGGASHGRYDVAAAACERLGAERLFWHVAMKPGTPFLAAFWHGHLVIGLSGNPAAALTTFDILLRPVLAALAGRPAWQPFTAQAVLDQDIVKTSGLRRYMRGTCYRQAGEPRVRTGMVQRSSVLSSMAQANCYVMVPEGSGPLGAGETVLTLSPDYPV